MDILDGNSPLRLWGELWKKRILIGASYLYTHDINAQLEHIYSFVGDIPISQIKLMQLDMMMADLASMNPNTGKPMAKKTLKSIKNTVSAIFDYALDNLVICQNPAKNLIIPKKAIREERRSLTVEEMLWIINTPHRGQIAALIMMLCGLRLGEVIPLLWSDIDFCNSYVSVSKSVFLTSANRYEIKHGTKNGKDRSVPIPHSLLILLKAEYAQSQSRYVCPKTDMAMQTPTSWRRLWQSYFGELNRQHCNRMEVKPNRFSPKKQNIVIDKITPHILRHTYATLLYSSGVDLLTARELLGHADVTTTLKIYTHLEKSLSQFSIKKLEDYLDNNLLSKRTEPSIEGHRFIPGVS